MGSENDLPKVQPAVAALDSLDVPLRVSVASAHRTPKRAASIAQSAREDGVGVIIALVQELETDKMVQQDWSTISQTSVCEIRESPLEVSIGHWSAPSYANWASSSSPMSKSIAPGGHTSVRVAASASDRASLSRTWRGG